MNFLSLREHPEMLEQFVEYFSKHWGNPAVYRDCMTAAVSTESPLPQWILALTPEKEIAGCVGLITNDFVSRMDLWPYLCALYVEEKFRCQGLGGKLIQVIGDCAARAGYSAMYCCTDHIGYYERYGFEFFATGYHPWDETSRIYRKQLERK